MRKNLFWLNDEQWSRIEPLLPTDVRGVERQDDRRVISGIVMCSRLAAGGAIARPNMVLRPRFIIALCVGPSAGFGRTCSGTLPEADDPQTHR
jgi:hypothetical protein